MVSVIHRLLKRVSLHGSCHLLSRVPSLILFCLTEIDLEIRASLRVTSLKDGSIILEHAGLLH